MVKISDDVPPNGPTVFLSYAHDDEDHKSAVLNLASLLVGHGIAVELDHWHSDSRRDWYAWMLREIQDADFVIVVASRGYRAVGDGATPKDVHRGVQAEAAVLRDLLYRDRETWVGRVLPVVLPGRSLEELPTFTQPYSASHFIIDSITDEGVDELLRVLTKQPRHTRPSPGRVPVLSNSPRPVSPPQLAGDLIRTAVDLTRRIRWPRERLNKTWKIVSLLVAPLLAGGSIALPGSGATALLETANGYSQAPADSSTQKPPAGTEDARKTTSTSAPSHSSTEPGREPSAGEFGSAGTPEQPGQPRQPATSSDPPPAGSLKILTVGHSFAPKIDRVTVAVQNTGSRPVLVKQIGIYMSDWGGGDEWTDPQEWHFTTSGEMYSGMPGYDGTRRTHGLIKLADSEFSAPLVGQGFIHTDGSWRRLLTFAPNKFLQGTTSIVVDLPTTHLLQLTRPDQAAGPMVEHTFNPERGSVFTRVDLRTPHDSTYACDYLRRPPDQPVCDSVDPQASVAPPQ